MRPSRLALARFLIGVQVAMALAIAGIYLMAQGLDLEGEFDPFAFFFLPILAVYGTVGYLVVRREPSNIIGILLCLSGPIWTSTEVLDIYASLRHDGRPLFGAVWAAWVGNWTWVPATALIAIFVLLLFPDGQLPSHRWRPVLWLAILGTSMASFTISIEDARVVGFPSPLRVTGPAVDLVSTVGMGIFLASFLAAASSLFFRMRNSNAERRQQVKWLLYPAALVGPLLSLAALS